MGTVVGSLCHNDPAGDWPVAALASRAQVVLRGKSGTRTVAIDDFVVDSYTTAVGRRRDGRRGALPDARRPRTSGHYQKIERKVGDFATAAAAAQISLAADGTIADAGVAIGALGPKALRVAAAEQLLKGSKPSKDLIAQAMREAEKPADPGADNRGSVEYKRAMAGVLVGRALTAAHSNAWASEVRNEDQRDGQRYRVRARRRAAHAAGVLSCAKSSGSPERTSAAIRRVAAAASSCSTATGP